MQIEFIPSPALIAVSSKIAAQINHKTEGGRCYVSQTLQNELLAAQDQGGFSSRAICQYTGIGASTLSRWRKVRTAAKLETPSFCKLQVTDEPTQRSTLCVTTATGLKIEGLAIAELAALLRSLGESH